MYQAKNQSTKHAAGGMQRPPSWAHPSLWGRYGFDSFDSSSLWLIQQGGAISKQSTSSNSNSNSNKTTKITMASEEVTTPSKRTWAKAREESNQLVLQAAMQDVEQEAVRMRQQRDDLKSQLNSQFEESKQSKEKLAEVQASLASKEHLAATASQEATTNKREFQSLQETMKTKEERMDRLERESDSLREEIRYV
jgi:chromosome segregation ATPase